MGLLLAALQAWLDEVQYEVPVRSVTHASAFSAKATGVSIMVSTVNTLNCAVTQVLEDVVHAFLCICTFGPWLFFKRSSQV